jgi:hypothetical protein
LRVHLYLNCAQDEDASEEVSPAAPPSGAGEGDGGEGGGEAEAGEGEVEEGALVEKSDDEGDAASIHAGSSVAPLVCPGSPSEDEDEVVEIAQVTPSPKISKNSKNFSGMGEMGARLERMKFLKIQMDQARALLQCVGPQLVSTLVPPLRKDVRSPIH